MQVGRLSRAWFNVVLLAVHEMKRKQNDWRQETSFCLCLGLYTRLKKIRFWFTSSVTELLVTICTKFICLFQVKLSHHIVISSKKIAKHLDMLADFAVYSATQKQEQICA